VTSTSFIGFAVGFSFLDAIKGWRSDALTRVAAISGVAGRYREWRMDRRLRRGSIEVGYASA
jgi:hypothetical protein